MVKKITILNSLFGYACSNSDQILSVSQSTKNDIIKYTKCDPNIISVTPLGVDEKFKKIGDKSVLESVREKYNLPNEFILFVGLIEPRKNVGLLIEAFAKLYYRVKLIWILIWLLPVAGVGSPTQ